MNDPLFLGIEIGGTKLQVGLGRPDGAVLDLERCRVEPERGAEGIRAMIAAAAARLLQRAGIEAGEIAGVGIGFGGPVDADRGRVIVSNQIEGWTDYSLAAWAQGLFGGAQVAIQNDAATAALGEARFGAGVGYDPVLYVTIGSGVGGGLVVDGQIYRGSGRGAMEIGHLWTQEERGPTDEGADHRPTLESRAAGWSIAREGQKHVAGSVGRSESGATSPLVRLCGGQASAVTTELMVQAVLAGDADSTRILADARTALARGLAHAITLLAPARVILGGGVSLIGEELWFEPIRLEVARRVFAPFRGSYEIVPAGLGEAVVVRGALALAADARNRERGVI